MDEKRTRAVTADIEIFRKLVAASVIVQIEYDQRDTKKLASRIKADDQAETNRQV